MSTKALEMSSQTTKTEYYQPDRYRTVSVAKARKRWVGPGTRLITYLRKHFITARSIFAHIFGDLGDPEVRLYTCPFRVVSG